MRDLSPYLCVADARAAGDWYVEVLGARRRGKPIVMPDNRIGHLELILGDTVVMMADPFDEAGVAPPDPDRGNAVTLHLSVSVDDLDAMAERAVAAGATLDRGPEDSPHGRTAVVHDPFGHRWMLNAEPT